jgi:hypothetical protein
LAEQLLDERELTGAILIVGVVGVRGEIGSRHLVESHGGASSSAAAAQGLSCAAA